MMTTAEITSTLSSEALDQLRTWLVNSVSSALASNPVGEPHEEAARRYLEEALAYSKANLPADMKARLSEDIVNELLGYGPIQSLLDDPTITEIMINGADHVYIERNGELERTGVIFPDDEAVLRLIDRIILPLGRRIDADSPTVDARLTDGSRVNAVIRPVAIDGPSLTIRKFAREKLQVPDLIRFGSLTSNMAQFLEACVVAKLNIVISGGTGSGKTTLLNVLSEFIPANERIVTIEDAAELQLHQEHIVRLEAKPPDTEGKGAVPIRHLVRNALRMRPNRIIVGEVRGGEALDMLQAMNTGHDGSLTTLHANTPRDAISRLETLVLLAGFDIPLRIVREQIASAVDLIVQQSRLRDGSRKVTSITEVIGMEGEVVVLNEIFKFQETGVGDNSQVIGELMPTGLRPMFDSRLKAAGFKLKPEIYGAELYQHPNPKRRRR